MRLVVLNRTSSAFLLEGKPISGCYLTRPIVDGWP